MRVIVCECVHESVLHACSALADVGPCTQGPPPPAAPLGFLRFPYLPNPTLTCGCNGSVNNRSLQWGRGDFKFIRTRFIVLSNSVWRVRPGFKVSQELVRGTESVSTGSSRVHKYRVCRQFKRWKSECIRSNIPPHKHTHSLNLVSFLHPLIPLPLSLLFLSFQFALLTRGVNIFVLLNF